MSNTPSWLRRLERPDRYQRKLIRRVERAITRLRERNPQRERLMPLPQVRVPEHCAHYVPWERRPAVVDAHRRVERWRQRREQAAGARG